MRKGVTETERERERFLTSSTSMRSGSPRPCFGPPWEDGEVATDGDEQQILGLARGREKRRRRRKTRRSTKRKTRTIMIDVRVDMRGRVIMPSAKPRGRDGFKNVNFLDILPYHPLTSSPESSTTSFVFFLLYFSIAAIRSTTSSNRPPQTYDRIPR